jgi:hypothetical protein
MPPNALIKLETASDRLCFDWSGFDGDDCFGSFVISVFCNDHLHSFDFGACAVQLLRKMSRFLSSPSQPSVGGGFRHPDIRTYDLHRIDDGFRLVVQFEGSGLHEEFTLVRPTIEDSRAFLSAYDDA